MGVAVRDDTVCLKSLHPTVKPRGNREAKDPAVLVGDDRGCVASLKLSPNLRRAQSEAADKETQIKNLQKLMDNAIKGEGNL